jgi:hypothetical protein
MQDVKTERCEMRRSTAYELKRSGEKGLLGYVKAGRGKISCEFGKDGKGYYVYDREGVLFRFADSTLLLKNQDKQTVQLLDHALGIFTDQLMADWNTVPAAERNQLAARFGDTWFSKDRAASAQWHKEVMAKAKIECKALGLLREVAFPEIEQALGNGSATCVFRKGPDIYSLASSDRDIPWISIWSRYGQAELAAISSTQTTAISFPLCKAMGALQIGNADSVRLATKKDADRRYAEMREEVRQIEYEIARQRIKAHEESLPQANSRIVWSRVESGEYVAWNARSEDKDRKERLEFLSSLNPDYWLVGVGLGGVLAYDAAIFESKNMALVDCPIVGHALFAVQMGEGWKSWLEQTRREIARLKGVTRIIHSGHWHECVVDALDGFDDKAVDIISTT